MKRKRPLHQRDWHERRLEAALYHDRPLKAGSRESKSSRETFAQRTKAPGEVGLANEARPGRGTRAKTAAGKDGAGKTKKKKPGATSKPARRKSVAHDHEPLGRVAPLPPAKPRATPREQPSNSLAHEQERDTGVSGHMSGD